jgi:hypothetical protein
VGRGGHTEGGRPGAHSTLTDEEDTVQALDRVATPIVWTMSRIRQVVVVDRTCVVFGRYADPLAAAPADTDRTAP